MTCISHGTLHLCLCLYFLSLSHTPPSSRILRYQDAKLGASNVKEFEVEFLMVQMEVTSRRGADAPPVFKKATFPVENRAAFGITQTPCTWL